MVCWLTCIKLIQWSSRVNTILARDKDCRFGVCDETISRNRGCGRGGSQLCRKKICERELCTE